MEGALGVGVAIAVAVGASTASFPLVAVALAPFARVWIVEGALGVGPKILEARIGGALWRVRLIPWSSYVIAHGMQAPELVSAEASAEAAARARDRGRLPWDEAPPTRRLFAFVVAPRLALFAVACAALGPARAAFAVVRGVPEVLFVGPSARAILDAAAAVGAREGFVTVAALAVCKLIALGVVALPTDLVFATSHRSDAWLAKVRAGVMLVTLGLMLAWIVAWARWALA
ncbi:MAG TPA: hypothetical protein VGM56_01405 [Byssovorax sp.]|jgi:membrane-associated protease RseP (regulator of RpoE activity)